MRGRPPPFLAIWKSPRRKRILSDEGSRIWPSWQGTFFLCETANPRSPKWACSWLPCDISEIEVNRYPNCSQLAKPHTVTAEVGLQAAGNPLGHFLLFSVLFSGFVLFCSRLPLTEHQGSTFPSAQSCFLLQEGKSRERALINTLQNKSQPKLFPKQRHPEELEGMESIHKGSRKSEEEAGRSQPVGARQSRHPVVCLCEPDGLHLKMFSFKAGLSWLALQAESPGWCKKRLSKLYGLFLNISVKDHSSI